MKKALFVAAAVAVLASCSEKSTVKVVSTVGNDIIFNAYTGSPAVRGNSIEVADVITTTNGIGVFAFYQPANSGLTSDFSIKKYPTPDFMYNQKVTPHSVTPAAYYADETEYNAAKGTSLSAAEFASLSQNEKIKTPISVDYWEYTPVKYWPNNEYDQISFFAYAPYDPAKAWNDLGYKTDVLATKLTASFPVYNEKSSMVDYFFATPALNKMRQRVATAPSTPSADVVSFAFKHIMSRVAINLGVVIDSLSTSTFVPMAWTDPNTSITVESIVLKDIAESYDYTYSMGSTSGESWVANGSQDLILNTGDFQNNVVDVTNYATAAWKPLLADENGKPGYLFIAPQNLTNAKLVITYKVATVDSTNASNNSTITNVIEKPIGVNFATGSAYTLNLLIGLKSVELSAEVDDSWTVVAPTHHIDVPANE